MIFAHTKLGLDEVNELVRKSIEVCVKHQVQLCMPLGLIFGQHFFSSVIHDLKRPFG